MITLPILLINRKYGAGFALKLVGLMLAAMAIAALAVDLLFSALEVVPQGRPSLESITDRGIAPNYTAVLNILFTLVGAALMWLTLRRGATDPVCGMRVDRTRPSTRPAGQPARLLLLGRLPRASSGFPGATPTSSRPLGWRPRGLLKERS